MNTNFLQTLLTVVTGVLSFATYLLVSFGCVQDVVSGKLDCSTAAGAPAFIAPYLGMVAAGIVVVKLVLAAFEGKLTKPTVAIDK